ncbi:MAG: twin-arginine translocase subunit TatC [Phycisphaerae bacterium]|nr:twin-arginine translocase subunit TatC [Phycisphaerae bacterium]
MPRDPNDTDINSIRMPLGEHLEELRRRLIRALLGLVVGVGVALAFTNTFLDALEHSYAKVMQETGQDPRLAAHAATAGIIIYCGVALVAGLVIASPWILYQLWMFVAAGLYHRERRMILSAVPASVLLFAGGAAFFLLVASMPLIRFLVAFNEWMGLRSVIMLNEHIRFMTRMLLVFGLAFQTPLVVFVLVRTGLVRRRAMHHYRKHVIVGMLVLAAVATSPSVVDQIALAVPMWLLYELGIALTYVFPPRRVT